jgi:hypothetical protein
VRQLAGVSAGYFPAQGPKDESAEQPEHINFISFLVIAKTEEGRILLPDKIFQKAIKGVKKVHTTGSTNKHTNNAT